MVSDFPDDLFRRWRVRRQKRRGVPKLLDDRAAPLAMLAFYVSGQFETRLLLNGAAVAAGPLRHRVVQLIRNLDRRHTPRQFYPSAGSERVNVRVAQTLPFLLDLKLLVGVEVARTRRESLSSIPVFANELHRIEIALDRRHLENALPIQQILTACFIARI